MRRLLSPFLLYYYISMVLAPPTGYRGSGISYSWRDKTRAQGDDTWVKATFPADFALNGADPSGAPSSPKLVPGDWTVLWYHVHADGKPYIINCDGFTVT